MDRWVGGWIDGWCGGERQRREEIQPNSQGEGVEKVFCESDEGATWFGESRRSDLKCASGSVDMEKALTNSAFFILFLFSFSRDAIYILRSRLLIATQGKGKKEKGEDKRGETKIHLSFPFSMSER